MGDLHRRKIMVILSARTTQSSATKKQRFSRENIYSIRRSGRTTVSVWGGMWLGGITPLYRVTNNLTSAQYVTNVLEGTLLPYVTTEFPAFDPVVFVQDK
jgi:hypothetical protein